MMLFDFAAHRLKYCTTYYETENQSQTTPFSLHSLQKLNSLYLNGNRLQGHCISRGSMTDNQENIIEDEDGPVLEDPVEEEEVADSIEADESDEDESEDDDDNDDELPWYKDEYFWLGEQTSDGYDWDNRSVGYRVQESIERQRWTTRPNYESRCTPRLDPCYPCARNEPPGQWNNPVAGRSVCVLGLIKSEGFISEYCVQPVGFFK